jgi:hypothetical protein
MGAPVETRILRIFETFLNNPPISMAISFRSKIGRDKRLYGGEKYQEKLGVFLVIWDRLGTFEFSEKFENAGDF